MSAEERRRVRERLLEALRRRLAEIGARVECEEDCARYDEYGECERWVRRCYVVYQGARFGVEELAG